MNGLIKLINEINDTSQGTGGLTHFPKIVKKEEMDLKWFKEQLSSYEGIKTEFVSQYGDGDYGYHGTVAIPYGEWFVVFEFDE